MPEEEKVIEIPLDQILEPSENIRASIDEEELEALARSLELVGQIEPVKVKREGEKYRIIDGFMRALASRRIGKVMIKATVLSPEEFKERALRIHPNLFRVAQDPIGEAEYYQMLMASWGTTTRELSERLMLPESRIKERLTLLDLPEDVGQALNKRKIGVGVAKQLGKVENELTRKELLRRAVADGLSENRAKIWAGEYSKVEKEAPPPPPEKIEETLKELEEFYSDPCEVCGGKIAKNDFGILEGHIRCLNDVRVAIAYEREQSAREKKEKPEEKPAG